MTSNRSFTCKPAPHLKADARRGELLVVDLSGFEGGGGGLALAGDHDHPLVAVLLDLDDRRRLQEHVGELALAEALDVLLQVLVRYVLVLADDLRHGDGDVRSVAFPCTRNQNESSSPKKDARRAGARRLL